MLCFVEFLGGTNHFFLLPMMLNHLRLSYTSYVHEFIKMLLSVNLRILEKSYFISNLLGKFICNRSSLPSAKKLFIE